MSKLAGLAAALAMALVAAPALAQTKPSNPVDAKFAAADADKSGHIDGKELEPFKAQMAKIDTDKDGKISRQELDVAVMTGLLK
jgi:Ca2+-binding EF-hand superfamily protein